MTDRPWVLRIAAFIMALIAAGWIRHAWQAGSYPTLVAEFIIVAGAVYLSFDDRIARIVPPAQTWKVDSPTGGIVLRPNLFRVCAFMTATMSLLLGFLLLGVLQMLGKLAAPGRTPPTARDHALLSLVPIVGVSCGLIALWLAGLFLQARGNMGSLVIDGEGVTLSSRHDTSIRWDAVRDVRLVGRTGSPGPARGKVTLIIDGQPEALKLPLKLFPRDAAVLADLVHFYWRNPADRHELGNNLALARWEARDFGPLVSPKMPDSSGSAE